MVVLGVILALFSGIIPGGLRETYEMLRIKWVGSEQNNIHCIIALAPKLMFLLVNLIMKESDK